MKEIKIYPLSVNWQTNQELSVYLTWVKYNPKNQLMSRLVYLIRVTIF